MSNSINTVDIIGDEELCAQIIGRTIEKLRIEQEIAIADYALYACTTLSVLVLSGGTVNTLQNVRGLSGTLIANGTGYIYVPSALLESYKAATNWSTYADQFRALEDYTVDGTTTGELDETKI